MVPCPQPHGAVVGATCAGSARSRSCVMMATKPASLRLLLTTGFKLKCRQGPSHRLLFNLFSAETWLKKSEKPVVIVPSCLSPSSALPASVNLRKRLLKKSITPQFIRAVLPAASLHQTGCKRVLSRDEFAIWDHQTSRILDQGYYHKSWGH